MPGYVLESVLAEHYHWTLDCIRDLDMIDFDTHVRICIIKEVLDKEFQAKLAGAGPDPEKHEPTKSTGPPNKSEFRGAHREVKTEKAVSFQSKIRAVKLDKKGNIIG